jgi:hypothetical protein
MSERPRGHEAANRVELHRQRRWRRSDQNDSRKGRCRNATRTLCAEAAVNLPESDWCERWPVEVGEVQDEEFATAAEQGRKSSDEVKNPMEVSEQAIVA